MFDFISDPSKVFTVTNRVVVRFYDVGHVDNCMVDYVDDISRQRSYYCSIDALVFVLALVGFAFFDLDYEMKSPEHDLFNVNVVVDYGNSLGWFD